MPGRRTAGAKGHTTGPDLTAIGLFRTLSAATLDAISQVAVVRHYVADEHIVYEGAPCEAAYFVLSGQVRIYRVSPAGREQVLVRLGTGQAFNTVPPFQDDGHNQASAVALSEVTLLVLLKDDFLTLVLSHPDLAMAVFRDFADRLVHLTGLVESLALYSVEQRLARFLLKQADAAAEERPGQRTGAGVPTQLPHRWTQQDIAMHLGTVRDVVGRALRSLEDEGLIRIDRGRIVLLDRDALVERAGL
jgi:CRP/FNR family transcriptional regulator